MSYHVEIDDPGCSACASGRTWVVIDPDGCAGGTSYGDQEDAERTASMLNAAYREGAKAATPNRRTGPADRRPLDPKPCDGTERRTSAFPRGRRREDDDIPF